MIARHEGQSGKSDIWAALAAKLPGGAVSWRQDGKATPRDGKFFARFVAYVDANTVRERLDSVVPGEWDLTLDLLPRIDGADDEAACAFKARLQILGVIREDVGCGRDYKSAATDAFKRAAVRFGVAHELYSYGQNWVQVDGDGKFAKPLEDPQAAYERRNGRATVAPRLAPAVVDATPLAQPDDAYAAGEWPRVPSEAKERGQPAATNPASPAGDEPSCPKCEGAMWDNRLTKRSPKAPDYKCKDKACDGVVWPPRDAKPGKVAVTAGGSDDLPF